jgi:perosamine synthetase
MAPDLIPVNTPLLNGNEKKYLIECIDTGWISSEGPFVKKFEEGMAQRASRKYAVAVTNGTVALELAVQSLELGPGDEVILPTFTIISCAYAIVRAGAKPVLVDSDRLTWNMDVNQVEAKITKATKAIMVVHIYGLPVDMDPILAIAKKYNLAIIEDVAEEQGQTYYGKPCGSFGDVSTYSFYPNKHITTGEGGMILTDNPKINEKVRSLRNLCFIPGNRFVHEELGSNSRMTNLQAAVGVAQLERFDETLKKKRYIGAEYNKLLLGCTCFDFPVRSMPYAENIYWVYGLVIKQGYDKDAKDAISFLAKAGVESRPFFWSMHEQPVFKKMGLFQNEHYPGAEHLARKGFYIPSGIGITEAQIAYVADVVKQLAKFINE